MKNFFIVIVAMVSGISGMLFGYDTGVISGAILFIKQEYPLLLLLPFLQELVISAVLIGAIIGAIIGGSLADRYGRRKMIIIAAIIFAGGAIGTSLTFNIIFLIIGRVIVGIAIGMASFIAPLYISEMSPPRIRGSLVSLNQLFITIGIVISYLVDYALTPISGWRYMLGLAAIPAIILLIAMIFMPSSPRWLVNNGEMEKARSTLIEIRRTNDINNELNEISTSLDKQKGGRKNLFNPLIRPAMIVGISLAIFQQVTGINTVIYYAPTIFEFAGFQSAAAAIFATIFVGIVNVLFTLVAIFLLDRVGRRKLLLLGLTGMSGMLIMLGIVFFLPSLLNQLGTLAAISLISYVGFFAIGLGPVFWLLISEIYPLKVRGLAMSIVTVANWGSNLIIALTFLTLIQLMGRTGTFWLYAVVGILALIFTYTYVPETKGRTLEEIEEHWRGGKHPRELGR
ncbi:MAG: sugar porter family MFS transporter [Candidatus Lokiarchaeota archaeon]|nr:sugar porter family MFS transporter [Candidatus Lokiarchaeota archaeon]